jgi:heptosyltransferase-2
VIFTTSLIGSVRQSWPDAVIHVVTAKRGEPLVRHHPLIDRLWVFDKSGKDRSLGSLLTLAKMLRNEKFDVLLNAHPSFRSRLLTFLSGAAVRVGYLGFGSAIAFTHRVSNSLDVRPDHADRRVDLLRELVPGAGAAALCVGIPESIKQDAEMLLAQMDSSVKPLLGLVPGSARRTKMWDANGFNDLGKRWIREKKGSVLVFGGESERARIEAICSEIGESCHSIIQRPLELAAGLLSRCERVVGNDTGVSFLAIAAGCPKVLVLYGCTQVNYSFPAPHAAIAAGVPCCLPRTGHGRACCKWGDTPWCMRQISVERVWSELLA